jgi:hypothetical protein
MIRVGQNTDQITRLRHSDCDVTEWTIVGRVTYAEIKRALAVYNGGPTSLFVLWDFSLADVKLIRSEDIFEMSEAAKARARLRAGGKTALVTNSDLAFGLARMYQSYREIAQVELPFMSFRTRVEAISWLKAKS